MTENKSKISNTFLDIKKSAIYFGLVVFGLFFLLIDQPGNTFVVVGLGLFYGHLCYRSIVFREQIVLKSIAIAIVTLTIGTALLLYYNTLRAVGLILISIVFSLGIEIAKKITAVNKS